MTRQATQQPKQEPAQQVEGEEDQAPVEEEAVQPYSFKLKLIWIIAGVLLFLIIILAVWMIFFMESESDNLLLDNMTLYESDYANFYYPNEWEVATTEYNEGKTREFKMDVKLLPINLEKCDICGLFIQVLPIHFLSLGSSDGIEKYTEMVTENIKTSGQQIIDSSPTTLSSVPAHKLIMTGSEPETEYQEGDPLYKWYVVYTIENNGSYRILLD